MNHTSLQDSAIAAFKDWSGREASQVATCPGRVNLIGEHVDYQMGFSLPIAIDRYTVAVGALTNGKSCEAFSSELGESGSFGVEPPGPTWARMVFGMRKLLGVTQAFRIYIDSNVPLGAGLSSSAALNLSVGFLLCKLAGITIDPFDLALLAQRSESEFGGTPCGLLDQIACTYSRQGRATLVDFRDPSHPTHVPFPKELVVAVVDSGVRHANASSGYAQRRQETEEAAQSLGVDFLRDAKLGAVEGLPELLRKRTRHVVTENARVLDFVESLKATKIERLGEILNAGHAGLRDDFEVSCPEMDALVSVCQKAPGAFGARMTGGGFGGSCVALVDAEKASEFVETMRGYGHEPILCSPADGWASTVEN